MSTCLLDVNVLIALLDRHHVHHPLAYSWFKEDTRLCWASCPLTENGVIRILSSNAYPNASLSVGQATALLVRLREFASHRFWPDDVSLLDPDLFQPDYISHSKQVTDIYLLGLAKRQKGKLVTLDRRISQSAVASAADHLLCLG